MAKTKKTAEVAETTAVTTPALSTKTQKLIDAIRPQFVAFAGGFASMLTSRLELAPKFMRAFGAWQADTAGTFVQFIRTLDASIPETRADYRTHSAYQAADYLRRLVAQQERAKADRTGAAEGTARKVAVTPLDAVARLLAAFLPNVNDKMKLWAMLGAELNWTERQISRVQHMAETMPALPLKAPKGTDIRVMAPLHGVAGRGEQQLQATGS